MDTLRLGPHPISSSAGRPKGCQETLQSLKHFVNGQFIGQGKTSFFFNVSRRKNQR